MFTMLCRLCVSEGLELLDMCKLYYGETPAIKYIVEVLDIKMDRENTALVMCSDCNTALSNFHSFCRVVREAQYKYNEMFDLKPHLAAGHKYLETYCMKDKLGDDDECGEFGEVPIKIEDVLKCKDEFNEDDFVVNVPGSSNQIGAWSPGRDSDSHGSGVEILKKSNNKNRTYDKVKKNIKALKKSMKKITKKHKAEEVTADSNINKKNKRQRYIRQKMAVKTLVDKYTMEGLCKGKEWVLTEDQREEMLSLFVDMQCSRCSAPTYTTYTQLERHSLKEHEELPILNCCTVENTGRTQLETHILYRHILHRRIPREKKFIPCPVCNKLINQDRRRQHLSTHLPNEKRGFQCDYCKLGFSRKTSLVIHISSKHSGPKLPCEICGKQFSCQTGLKYHMKQTHTPDVDPFLCPECGKKLKHSETYHKHINAHHRTAEKVKCHICNSVVKKSYFNRHLTYHNPDKKKNCPYCPYRSYNIQDHIKRIHEKDKRFACAYCPKAFHIEKGLKDHISSQHTGVPGYSCEFCDKTFMSSANCHTHTKRIHPVQLAEKRMKIANEKNMGFVCDATMVMTSSKKTTVLEGEEAEMLVQNIQSLPTRYTKHPKTIEMTQKKIFSKRNNSCEDQMTES